MWRLFRPEFQKPSSSPVFVINSFKTKRRTQNRGRRVGELVSIYFARRWVRVGMIQAAATISRSPKSIHPDNRVTTIGAASVPRNCEDEQFPSELFPDVVVEFVIANPSL